MCTTVRKKGWVIPDGFSTQAEEMKQFEKVSASWMKYLRRARRSLKNSVLFYLYDFVQHSQVVIFFLWKTSWKKSLGHFFFFFFEQVFLDLPSPVCLKIHFCSGNVKLKRAQTQIKAQKPTWALMSSKTMWILWGKMLLHCIHCFPQEVWNLFFLTILSIKKQ